nr:hypothetical protein [Xylanimonas allomyrinae]
MFATSSTVVVTPSDASFCTYCEGFFVGLFDRYRTGMSRRCSSPINRSAPGSRWSPR